MTDRESRTLRAMGKAMHAIVQSAAARGETIDTSLSSAPLENARKREEEVDALGEGEQRMLRELCSFFDQGGDEESKNEKTKKWEVVRAKEIIESLQFNVNFPALPYGETFLSHAVYHSLDMVRMLIDKGADVNAENEMMSECALDQLLEEEENEDGLSAERGAMKELLLSRGAKTAEERWMEMAESVRRGDDDESAEEGDGGNGQLDARIQTTATSDANYFRAMSGDVVIGIASHLCPNEIAAMGLTCRRMRDLFFNADDDGMSFVNGITKRIIDATTTEDQREAVYPFFESWPERWGMLRDGGKHSAFYRIKFCGEVTKMATKRSQRMVQSFRVYCNRFRGGVHPSCFEFLHQGNVLYHETPDCEAAQLDNGDFMDDDDYDALLCYLPRPHLSPEFLVRVGAPPSVMEAAAFYQTKDDYDDLDEDHWVEAQILL